MKNVYCVPHEIEHHFFFAEPWVRYLTYELQIFICNADRINKN